MAGWYPSHMPKARRELRDNLRLVDVVIEVVDARIPESSRIPNLDSMLGSKSLLVALNKSDLADPHTTSDWVRHYKLANITAVPVDAVKGVGVKPLIDAAHAQANRVSAGRRRLRPMRAMMVGIPNVGKSSLLNRILGRRSAKTGERPGITRGKQWIALRRDFELLDLPGIMWPEQQHSEGFMRLCITGAIPDDVVDKIEVASALIHILLDKNPDCLRSRYGIAEPSSSAQSMLEAVALRRGFLGAGGVPDLTKAALAVLQDFRSARLGRLSLERPPLHSK